MGEALLFSFRFKTGKFTWFLLGGRNKVLGELRYKGNIRNMAEGGKCAAVLSSKPAVACDTQYEYGQEHGSNGIELTVEAVH